MSVPPFSQDLFWLQAFIDALTLFKEFIFSYFPPPPRIWSVDFLDHLCCYTLWLWCRSLELPISVRRRILTECYGRADRADCARVGTADGFLRNSGEDPGFPGLQTFRTLPWSLCWCSLLKGWVELWAKIEGSEKGELAKPDLRDSEADEGTKKLRF